MFINLLLDTFNFPHLKRLFSLHLFRLETKDKNPACSRLLSSKEFSDESNMIFGFKFFHTYVKSKQYLMSLLYH